MAKVKEITIKDIADMTGLSISSVSNALNFKDEKISEQNRRLVFETARTIGYRKCVVNTRKVLFLIAMPEWIGERYKNIAHLRMVSGMKRELEKNEFELLTEVVSLSAFRQRLVDAAVSDEFDGIIILGHYVTKEMGEVIGELRVPIVMIDPGYVVTETDSVKMDNYNISYALASFLASRKYRRPGIVTIQEDNVDFARRYEGFLDGLHEEGMKVRSDHIYRTHMGNLHDELKAILLEKKNTVLPDVVYCMNDYFATSTLDVLDECGIKMQVVGYDHMPVDEKYRNRLITIEPNFFEMGQITSRILMDRMNDYFIPFTTTIINARIIDPNR